MRLPLSSLFAFAGAIGLCTLAACGGGGGGSAAVPVTRASQSPGTSVTPAGTANATFAVSLQQYVPVKTSSAQRGPAFVSPATTSISVALVSVNGQAQAGPPTTYAINPSAPSCAGGNGLVTCTLNTTLPIGNDTLTVTTLDSGARVLGTTTMAATIEMNSTNRIALSVGGQIASLEIFLSTALFVTGTAANANVVVVPLDASGAAIVNPGNYSSPITLTAVNNVGATGHLSLVTNGVNTALNGTINSPNDQVVLHYDGAGVSGSTTLTAAVGVPVSPVSVSAAFNATALTATSTGTQFTTLSQYAFTAAGQTGTITAGGGTGPYTIASSDTSLATVSGTSPNFTVTSVGYGLTGSGTITITDSAAATSTVSMTFVASPVTLSVTTCGATATCTVQGATYPIPLSGPAASIAPTTIRASGGTGTYNYFFASTGTTTSALASVSQVGPSMTITPSGFGNDALIVTSGGQTTLFGINASPNVFAQTLPAAIGMLLEGVGKSYSATLPATVTGASQLTGATNNSFAFSAIGPTITATPQTAGTGSFRFTNAFGNASVNFTVFGVSFGTYAGAGSTRSTESYVPSDEQFTATGQSDIVTVSGLGGALSAVSGNTTIATVSVSGNQATVTSVAPGFTTIALTDAGTGASVTYTVSVTTAVIPIADRARRP